MTDFRRQLSKLSGAGTVRSLWHIPIADWRKALFGAWTEANDDNIGLVAAGVAFYGFLAIVPLLGIIVLVYGFAADPGDVARDMEAIMTIVPADTAQLINDLLANVVHSSEGKKGLGVLIALAVALYGGMNGASAVVTALNIAYEREERRSFARVTLLALTITATAILLTIITLIVMAIVARISSLLPEAAPMTVAVGKVASFALVGAVGAAAAATLYRYGPDHEDARWVWLTPGSAFASGSWLLISVGFGFYVKNFGNYNVTYGSIGAVIITLTWIYLSAYVLLLGAELNAELEHRIAPKPEPAVKESLSDKPGEQDLRPAPDIAEPAPPSIAKDLIISRASARAAHIAGFEKVPALPSILGTAGFAMLRREGRAGRGILLLTAGGVIAWLGRRAAADNA